MHPMVESQASSETDITTSTSRRLPRHVFLIGSIILLICSAFFLQHVCWVEKWNKDQGLFPLGADLVARGGLLYRDFYTIAWPGSYFFLAAFFKIFGSSWAVCVSVLVGELLAMQCLILRLSRRIIDGWLVFLPAAMFAVLGSIVWSNNYYYWEVLLFYLLTITCLCESFSRSGRAQTIFALLAGLAAGCTVMCTQALGPSVLLTLLTGVVVYFRAVPERSRAVQLSACVFGAAGAVMVALLGYFLATGTLTDMLHHCLQFVVSRYHGINTVPYGWCPIFDDVVRNLSTNAITGAISLFAWIPFELIRDAPFLVLLGLLLSKLAGADLKSEIVRRPAVLLLMVAGLSFSFTQLHRPDVHRLFWSTECLMIVLVFFFERGIVWIKEKCGSSLSRCVLGTVASIVFIGIGLNLFISFAHAKVAMTVNSRRGPVPCTEDLSIVEAIQSVTKPYEKVLVYPYEPVLYYLTATSYPGKSPWLVYNYDSPETFRLAIDDMEKNRVRYAAIDTRMRYDTMQNFGYISYRDVPADQRVMEQYLSTKYRQVGKYGRYLLLERNPD